jgi:hypothetical protein
MKTIDDLTPEIEAKIPEYIERATSNVFDGSVRGTDTPQEIMDDVDNVYNLGKQEQKPIILIADTPLEFKKLYHFIEREGTDKTFDKKVLDLFNMRNPTINNTGKAEDEVPTTDQSFQNGMKDLYDYIDTVYVDVSKVTGKLHWLFCIGLYSRVYFSWYRFIHKELDVPCSLSDELEKFYQRSQKSSIAGVYFTYGVALVLRTPESVVRDENEGLHNVYGPAIKYPDTELYYINGRHVENWIFEKYDAGTLTFEDFNSQDNEDVRASIVTLIKERDGEKALMDFLGAKLIDETEVDHNLEYKETLRLYKTEQSYSELVNSKGDSNNPYAWVEMTCPSTGQVYLIDTCPTFNDVVECAKWHRPEGVPPEIRYEWMSAN